MANSSTDTDSDDGNDGLYTSEDILLSMGFSKSFTKDVELNTTRTSTDVLQCSSHGRCTNFLFHFNNKNQEQLFRNLLLLIPFDKGRPNL